MWCFLQQWWWRGSYCGNAPLVKANTAVIKDKENGTMRRERDTFTAAKTRMKETKWERRCFSNEDKAGMLENSKQLKFSVQTPTYLVLYGKDSNYKEPCKKNKITRPFCFILNADICTHHLIKNLQTRNSSSLSVLSCRCETFKLLCTNCGYKIMITTYVYAGFFLKKPKVSKACKPKKAPK